MTLEWIDLYWSLGVGLILLAIHNYLDIWVCCYFAILVNHIGGKNINYICTEMCCGPSELLTPPVPYSNSESWGVVMAKVTCVRVRRKAGPHPETHFLTAQASGQMPLCNLAGAGGGETSAHARHQIHSKHNLFPYTERFRNMGQKTLRKVFFSHKLDLLEYEIWG